MTVTAKPAVYTPFHTGQYRVQGPWYELKYDVLNNGDADAKQFQLDREFWEYHREKMSVRKERYQHHICEDRMSAETEARVVQHIAEKRLPQESSEWFSLHSNKGGFTLECRLTDERLDFDQDWRMIQTSNASYRSALDALACQVQEDIAIVRWVNGENWLAYCHVCMPSGWRPHEKIGLSFMKIHQPVPEFRDSAKKERSHLRTMMSDNRPVRFIWTIQIDDQLNHYPGQYKRIPFDVNDPRGGVRVERQTAMKVDEHTIIFTIRIYRISFDDIIKLCLHKQLSESLKSMNEETLRYKGLKDLVDPLTQWLDGR